MRKPCRIIAELLQNEAIDKVKEKEMFDFITYRHEFTFQRIAGDKIWVSCYDS